MLNPNISDLVYCCAAVDALREAIGTSQGAELGQLLVLERLEVTYPVVFFRAQKLLPACNQAWQHCTGGR